MLWKGYLLFIQIRYCISIEIAATVLVYFILGNIYLVILFICSEYFQWYFTNDAKRNAISAVAMDGKIRLSTCVSQFIFPLHSILIFISPLMHFTKMEGTKWLKSNSSCVKFNHALKILQHPVLAVHTYYRYLQRKNNSTSSNMERREKKL